MHAMHESDSDGDGSDGSFDGYGSDEYSEDDGSDEDTGDDKPIGLTKVCAPLQ